jgi:beta-1,4-mannosyl-glycoprotein beta-1,4-N-acetylglucosaminyltransferase
MIITAQMFLNELDIFEVKLHELKGIVDLHVVLEATTTHTGISKPLYFSENQARFREWPIHHIVSEETFSLSTHEIDDSNRSILLREVAKLKPDILLWVDADEVPRASTVQRFLASDHPACCLQMDNVWWRFNRQCVADPHNNNGIACRYPVNMHSNRAANAFPILADGGWHFEFFGSRADVLEKINATAHAVEPGSRATWRAVYDGHPFAGMNLAPYPIERLPRYVLDNRERFARYFQIQ